MTTKRRIELLQEAVRYFRKAERGGVYESGICYALLKGMTSAERTEFHLSGTIASLMAFGIPPTSYYRKYRYYYFTRTKAGLRARIRACNKAIIELKKKT